MIANEDMSMTGFPERVYVSTKTVYGYCAVSFSCATDDIYKAVDISNRETEVGIYQLVRVAKFKKTAVEIQSTVKEIIG